MTLKFATVLAFERKICPSDGLMYAGSWHNRSEKGSWKPIGVRHKDVRGTMSQRLKSPEKKEALKLDAEIQNPNLQAVDVAMLPFDADTLKLLFTIKVLGNVSTPCACNNQLYQEALVNKIGTYLEAQQCRELSLRYAENLASGRFLWRNRIVAEALEIRVSAIKGDKVETSWGFDGHSFSLARFSRREDPNIAGLAECIRLGLMGESVVLLQVEAFARIGMGQEVFPSQELALDSVKSKVLYSVEEIAAMHSQKLGNAIRTIDTWYPRADEGGPIAAEPYGAVTNRGVVYRRPLEKCDFYTLLDDWILKDKILPVEQQHFVVACLIRGGVFGGKETE